MGPSQARPKSASVMALAGPRTSHREELPSQPCLGMAWTQNREVSRGAGAQCCEQALNGPTGARLRMLRGRCPLLHPLTPRHWTVPARRGAGACGERGQPPAAPPLSGPRADSGRA